MNTSLSRRIVGAFGVATALLLASCGGSSSSSDSTEAATGSTEAPVTETLPVDVAVTEAPELLPVSGGELVVGVGAESTGLNPQGDAWGEEGHIIGRAIFDSLMTYDESGKPVPYLAESVEGNADATVWTITVRPGVSFHDGTPLNADAVMANFAAAQSSMTASSQVSLIGSMKVVDDLALEITMTAPWASFPNLLTGGYAGQVGYMAAPSMLTSADGSRNPVGTGPFVFSEWATDDHITVVRNDDYWQKPAYLDSITYRVIPDSSARLAAFDAGDIDLMYTANSADVTDYLAKEDSGEVTVVVGTPSAPDVIALNTKVAPLDDVRVRKALAMSIDMTRVIELLNGTGIKTPMHGPYADSSYWFVDTGYPEFDLDGAKALVDEYTAEKGAAPEFDYIGGTDPVIVSYMELLQSMWADAGITVNVVSQAQAENIGAVLGGTFQMAGWSGIGGDDPDNDYKYFHSGGLNITGYTSATMDAAMDAGRANPDPEGRKAEYAKVQQELTDNQPFLWMGSNQFAVIASTKVNGIASFTLPDGSLGQPLTGPRFFAKDVWISE